MFSQLLRQMSAKVSGHLSGTVSGKFSDLEDAFGVAALFLLLFLGLTLSGAA